MQPLLIRYHVRLRVDVQVSASTVLPDPGQMCVEGRGVGGWMSELTGGSNVAPSRCKEWLLGFVGEWSRNEGRSGVDWSQHRCSGALMALGVCLGSDHRLVFSASFLVVIVDLLLIAPRMARKDCVRSLPKSALARTIAPGSSC